MMSQANGITTTTVNNNKINVNGTDTNSDNVLELIQNIQTLAPEIKENLILISQKFTQFIYYAENLNKLSSKIEEMQLNQERLERELEQFRNDQRETEKQLEINTDGRVYLDVGGQSFTTTVKTLTEHPNSLFFKKLLTEKWSTKTNSADNPVFIDRDGRLFDHILKYLRTGVLTTEDKTVRKELLLEAKYYKLQSLQDNLNLMLRKDESVMTVDPGMTASSSPPCSPIPTIPKYRPSFNSPTSPMSNITRTLSLNQSMPTKVRPHPAQTASSWRSQSNLETRLNVFPDSILLTPEYEEKLIEFIGVNIQQQQQQVSWRLIYRASEHGFEAADFHRCCEPYAPTISIIQTDFGNIFGGFTSVPWSSAITRADQADPTAFLFTLKNTFNVPPTKFPIAREYQQCAISHNPTCGPNFGSPKNEGSDLCLRNKFNEKTNCVFFPKSYVDTTSYGGLIFAKKYFACKEVEVFTLMINN